MVSIFKIIGRLASSMMAATTRTDDLSICSGCHENHNKPGPPNKVPEEIKSRSICSGSNENLNKPGPFNKIPEEIKSMIFREVIRDLPSCIINFDFSFQYSVEESESKINLVGEMTASTSRVEHVKALLSTCTSSSSEVPRNMTKIGILGPENGPDMQKCADVFTLGVEPWSSGDNRIWVWANTEEDKVVLKLGCVEQLYGLGGSLALAGVKHLVLWEDKDVFADYLSYPQKMRDLLDLFRTACPDLVNLQIYLNGQCILNPSTTQASELNFFNVDELHDSTFFDGSGKSLPNWEMTHCLEKNDSEIRHFKSYMRENANEESVKFWERVNLKKCWLGELFSSANIRMPGVIGGTRIWFEDELIYTPIHEDGSLLDMYKGITQLFDDAPW